MFKIAKIWIEFEFEIPWKINRVLPYAEALVRSLNKDNDTYIIEVDREYYSNQIEFKLRSTWDILGWITYFQEFLRLCYRHMVDINCTWSPFVWTHIHLFLEKDWVPYSWVARGKKVPIFDYVYSLFYEFLHENKLWIREDVIVDEARRLSSNHNILRHFDKQYLKNWIKRNLEDIYQMYPMFHNGINRPKYAPVIWSLANEETWKPHSLEIRAIPNSWMLTSSDTDVYSFLMRIEKILNERHDRRKDYASYILNTNKKLLQMSIQNWNFFWH